MGLPLVGLSSARSGHGVCMDLGGMTAVGPLMGMYCMYSVSYVLNFTYVSYVIR